MTQSRSSFSETVHIYPAVGRAHVMTEDCWCEPKREPDRPNVLVHNKELWYGYEISLEQ